MDDFKLIYKILKYIRESMKYEEFDEEHFNAKAFGVSETEFFFVVRALLQDEYIEGVECTTCIGDNNYVVPIRPTLTIKGMDYLANNTNMKKAYRLAKGIKELIPGI